MANNVRYTAAKRRELAAARAAELAAWKLEVATRWSAERMAEHLAAVTVLSPAGNVYEFAADGRGEVEVPLLEAAANAIAAVRAELDLA